MRKLGLQFSGFHLDPKLGPHILEHDGNRLDNQLIGIGLAIDDDLMLRLFSLLELPSKWIISTAFRAFTRGPRQI